MERLGKAWQTPLLEVLEFDEEDVEAGIGPVIDSGAPSFDDS